MAVAPEKNPLLIQDFDDDDHHHDAEGRISSSRNSHVHALPPIPLVLFPGGGATVYKFFLLDVLGRRVLAFWDPNIASFSESSPRLSRSPAEEQPSPAFTTLRDLARHFADVLRAEMEPGPVLLGGWSCGGNIALEVAHVLASSASGFEVTGLVLIDSGFPNFDNHDKENEKGEDAVSSSEKAAVLQVLDMPLSSDIPDESQRAIRKAMRTAHDMLVRWRAPRWDGVVGESNSDKEISSSDGTPKIHLPKAVLYHAVESLHGIGERSARLGWEAYPYDFIESVVDIGGDHFTLFDEENVHGLSDKLREACNGFERCFYAKRCLDGGREKF